MDNLETYNTCLILHGCPADSEHIIPKEQRWMNWLADKLGELGYDAHALDMPTPWAPQYEEWKAELEKYPVNEETLLVGHSCGAAFLVRWLLETKKRVKRLILVAPAKVPEKVPDLRNVLYEFELSKSTVPIADEIVLFTSNDFPHHLESRQLYIDALDPKVIELPNKGHFLIFTMHTNEFPELLEEATRSL